MLLPTTMVGSYPRPRWFTYQLEGRDIFEAFKVIHHHEAYEDAVRTVVKDQELAGLDVLTDGQMNFDDYGMGIGSFLWYWYERIVGVDPVKVVHPARSKAKGTDVAMLDEVGSARVVGPVARGPVRLATMWKMAQRLTDRPIKACVGAGPVQLAMGLTYESGPIKGWRDMARALVEVFRAEIEDLVEAGCKHVQLEDLGAWVPNLTGRDDAALVLEVTNRVLEGWADRGVTTSWHFCFGNTWGSRNHGLTKGGYENALPWYRESIAQSFVIDFACREMEDARLLATLQDSRRVDVGVIDVRSLEVEQDEQVAERIRKVLRHIAAERVTLTTDCGMKQLPRYSAVGKLRAMVAGARIVREELGRS
ncbi:MAG: hypothetical protein IT379_34790 [Deltaproteobacteria bacterium]|nr:hypothetical protein [Deltaproteobacteria bacterium]